MSDAALAWFRAQLDDDERVARYILVFGWEHYARGGDVEDWTVGRRVNNAEPPLYDYRVVHTEHPGLREHDIVRLESVGDEFVARYIARFGSPKRVLAEIEAKRAILDDYDTLVSAIRRVDDVEGNQLLYARRDARMSDIRWLAQPYADRPGFPEEWR